MRRLATSITRMRARIKNRSPAELTRLEKELGIKSSHLKKIGSTGKRIQLLRRIVETRREVQARMQNAQGPLTRLNVPRFPTHASRGLSLSFSEWLLSQCYLIAQKRIPSKQQLGLWEPTKGPDFSRSQWWGMAKMNFDASTRTFSVRFTIPVLGETSFRRLFPTPSYERKLVTYQDKPGIEYHIQGKLTPELVETGHFILRGLENDIALGRYDRTWGSRTHRVVND